MCRRTRRLPNETRLPDTRHIANSGISNAGDLSVRAGAITIDGLGKRYSLDSRVDHESEDIDHEDPDNRELSGIRSLLGGPRSELWALRNISCMIGPGERVAIVGANGCGKSTLIQILSRTLPPSEGSIVGSGVVVPFGALKKPISLQASGCDNLRMLARLLGIPLAQLDERLPDIIAFSGLGDRAFQPVSRYSGRFYAQLSAAMGLLVDADIYLVDDDLKFGGESFRDKFRNKFADVLRRNVTLIYASNNLNELRTYCRRALWLDQGRLVADGEANMVVQQFAVSSDDAIDFSDLVLNQKKDVEKVERDPELTPPFALDGRTLVPVSDWIADVNRAEHAWQEVLARWRENASPGDLTVGSKTATSQTLGDIQAMRCLNSGGQPFRRCLPGEDLVVELLIETFASGVTLAVRLEMDVYPVLIFVAEPIVSLIARTPGTYLFRVEIPSRLMAHVAENMKVRLRTRALLTAPEIDQREMSTATVRYALCGDVRVVFDRERQSNGHPATILGEPEPASIQQTEAIDEASERARLSHWDILNRRPLLRPKLNWMIHKIAH